MCSVVPAFSLLLYGFDLKNIEVLYGYSIGVLTNTDAQFSLANFSSINSFSKLKFRWVVSQGEHLQIFPIELVFPDNISYYYGLDLELPFDYPNLVQWSDNTSPIVVTTLLYSFEFRLVDYRNFAMLKFYITQQQGYVRDFISLPSGGLFCPTPLYDSQQRQCLQDA